MEKDKRILLPRIPLNSSGAYADIKYAVNEELGISALVYKEYEETFSDIVERFKPLPYKKESIDGIIYKTKSLSIKRNLFGLVYTFLIKCYCFKEDSEYKESIKHIKYEAITNDDEHTIFIECARVGKYFDPFTLDDSLQHEIHHVFQHSKGVNTVTKKNMPKYLYDRCVQYIKNESGNPYIRTIAQGIYLSYETEQEAFVNGLDAILSKEVSRMNRHIDFYQSDAYKSVGSIDEAINVLQSNKVSDKILEIIFGKTREQIYKILMDGRKSFSKKIGRVIVKNDKPHPNVLYNFVGHVKTLSDYWT